ncbi:MAG: ankyrin repeat domain-containing protein [Novosphingobium sp.]|nr:ankyrin repeat domain-containing protein [Novosphingobium sp.]
MQAKGLKQIVPVVLAALAGAVLVAMPARAQFSDSYKFLEAVKKQDGQAVTDYLNEPGTTIVNTRDITSGDSALHIVTQRRDVAWIRFLIAKGADPNLQNTKGVTPLGLAVGVGFIEGAQALLDAGARVDDASQTGETPLITAVHRRDVAIVRALLKAGANPDRADNSGRSARDYAALDGPSSQVLSAIESADKQEKRQQAPQKVYGPSF